MRILGGALFLIAAVCPQAWAGSSVSITFGDLTINFRDPALAPKPGPQQHYVAEYLAAAASHDPAQFQALIHPAGLKCLGDEAGQKFLGNFTERVFRRNIPADATIVMVEPTSNMAPPPAPGAMSYVPARPDLVVAIDYDFSGADAAGKGKGSGQTIVDMLALDGGKLKLVPHCLTKEGSAKFLERLKAQGQ